MRKSVVATVTAVLSGLAVLSLPAPVSAEPKQPKIVYFTFDDGPDGVNDPRLLKVLHREQVPATFFLVGRSLAVDPGAAARLYLAGHAVGNHTWNHSDLTALSTGGVDHELLATQRLIGPVGGRCMRPPYGAVSPTVIGASNSLGLKVVLWTVDPEDWANQNAPYIIDHVLTHVRNRSIVLLHDGGGVRTATVSAVKTLIPALRARGYEFRTVPACRVPFKQVMFGAASPGKPTPKPTPDPTPTQPSAPAPTPMVVP